MSFPAKKVRGIRCEGSINGQDWLIREFDGVAKSRRDNTRLGNSLNRYECNVAAIGCLRNL